MRISALVAGYTGGSFIYENKGEFINGFKYFTDRDIHNNVITAKQYQMDLDSFKEVALQRNLAPILYNLKKEAGHITFDRHQLTCEEVLALKEEDLTNREINWAPLTIQLAGRLPTTKSLDHIAYDLDYFASEYAQYKNRITNSFEGEKQAEELQVLNKLIHSHLKKYSEQFAELTGNFLKQHEFAAEKNSIKAAIYNLFTERLNDYSAFIESNKDYADILGTTDEWLIADNVFMGESLRYAFQSKHPDWLTSGDGYKINDLTTLGALVKEIQSVDYQNPGLSSVNRNKSEEEFALELGLTGMKFELIKKAYKPTDALKQVLDEAFGKFIAYQNKLAGDNVLAHRNDPFVRNKEAYAIDWNQEKVLSLVNRLIGTLNSDNLNETFQKDIRLIAALYKEKASDRETGLLSRYHPYHNSWSKGQYVGDWNQFIRRLSLTSCFDFQSYYLQDYISLLDISV